jgi:hypothetical protein
MARSESFANLDADALGKSLRRIDGRGIQNGVERIWFQGGEPYFDVHLELIAGELDWFQLTFRSRSVTWSRDNGHVVTGRTTEGRVEDSPHPGSKTVQTDGAVDAALVAFARKIVLARGDDGHFERIAGILATAG